MGSEQSSLFRILDILRISLDLRYRHFLSSPEEESSIWSLPSDIEPLVYDTGPGRFLCCDVRSPRKISRLLPSSLSSDEAAGRRTTLGMAMGINQSG